MRFAQLAHSGYNRRLSWSISVKQTHSISYKLSPGDEPLSQCLFASQNYQANTFRQRQLIGGVADRESAKDGDIKFAEDLIEHLAEQQRSGAE